MPVMFIGHGSPMNILENNEFTTNWKNIALTLPKPKAILCISAHWFTNGTFISNSKSPETIYDFWGFPPELYKIKYIASGDLVLADEIYKLLKSFEIKKLHYGIDHGAWCVLHAMYPNADIPVLQLSVNANFTTEDCFQVGKLLNKLRDEEILIIGSGDVVHNLELVDFEIENGFDWATKFDNYICNSIVEKNFEKVINYKIFGESANKSFYTREHFDPLIYILGCCDENDEVKVFNKRCIYGALSMTSYIFSNTDKN